MGELDKVGVQLMFHGKMGTGRNGGRGVCSRLGRDVDGQRQVP